MGKTIGELVRSSDTDGMLVTPRGEGILTEENYKRLKLLFDGSVVLSGNNIKLQSTYK